MSIYSRSVNSSLDVKLDRAQSSSFDKWLQIQYLPSGFKCNEEELKKQTHKPWHKRIKFDLKELCHFFSIAIILIWIFSVFIFAIYLLGPCSPFQPPKRSNYSYSSRPNMSTTIAGWKANRTARNVRAAVQPRSQLAYVEQLLGMAPSKQPANRDEPNHPDCLMLSIYAIANLAFSSLMLLYLTFYILHMVELFESFPWFAMEICAVIVFVLVTFGLVLTLCITFTISSANILAILGIAQFAFGMLFR